MDALEALERLRLAYVAKSITADARKTDAAGIKKSLVARRQVLNPKKKKKLPRCADLPRGSHIALTTTIRSNSII
jgi:hypothetical protein